MFNIYNILSDIYNQKHIKGSTTKAKKLIKKKHVYLERLTRYNTDVFQTLGKFD